MRYATPTIPGTVVLSAWKLDVPFGAPALLATFGPIQNLRSGNQTTVAAFNLRDYQPSDRIELTNSIGVSIGSGDSGVGWAVPNDETYVEFFDLAANPPAFVTQHVYSSTSSLPAYDYDHFGLANDLAISRDGDWAVVNSDNWIHVFFLGQFPQITTTGFNIGALDGPCSPNLAVDSVAMTNERAVVTTARWSTTFNTYTTWVYIVDLTTSPPTIALPYAIVPPHGWNQGGDDYDRPHDIAITSARLQDRFAIVTTTHGVAAFDLLTDSPAGSYFNEDDWRRYQKQVDSVEVTDEDVLVIGDNDSSGTMQWHVRQFKVNSASGMVPFNPPGYGPAPSSTETHAHDLAIDLGFDKAIVRASTDNVCFRGLGTATQVVDVLPTLPQQAQLPDAYAYEQFKQQTQYNIFSSDAAVIAPETGGRIFAATIGGYQGPSGLWTGVVDVIDLNVPHVPLPQPLTVVQVPIAPNAAPGCVPVDLAISANHTELVVRSADPNIEVSPAAGPDLVRILLAPTPAIFANHGGSGTVMGLDSLAIQPLGFVAVAKRMLSISEQEGTSSGNDYTHTDR